MIGNNKSQSARSARGAERGSALLLVAIALAVLAIIGLAAVEFTGRDVGSSRITQRQNAVQQCALAARNWILSQYRLSIGQLPTAGSSLVVPVDGTNGLASVTLTAGAHYSGSNTSPSTPPSNLGGVAKGAGDLTNRLTTGNTSSRSVYTATCKDTENRTYEVEFAIQTGF